MLNIPFEGSDGATSLATHAVLDPLRGQLRGVLCYPGEPGYEQARTIWNAMIDKRPALIARCKNSQDVILRTTFAAHNSSLDAGQPAGMHYYWKSEYVTGLPDAAIEILVTFAASMTSPYSRINIFQLGGAIQRYTEQAMAMSHRNTEYVLAINTGWAEAKDTEQQVQWTRDCWTAIRLFSSGGVYVNFLSADDGEDRVRAAYGVVKYERLAQLKSKYDPQNLFRMNQNIKPVA